MALPKKLLNERAKYLAAKKIKDRNDCSVKAVAIACNVPYSEAHKALEQAGRKTNKGAFLFQMKKAILRLGCKISPLESWKGKTTKTLDLPRQDRYIAVTCNHALAVQFGLVKDYSSEKNYRVQYVWKVTKDSTVKGAE